MKTQVRLVTIILAGITIGIVAVKIRNDAVPLTERIVSADDGMRNWALRDFSKKPLEERERVVNALIDEKLVSKNADQRRHAIYALRKSGVNSPRIVNAMIVALNDENARVQEEARNGMAELGESAIPAIIQVLGRQWTGRHHLTTAMARATTPKSVPILIETIRKGNYMQVRGVAGTLAMISNSQVLAAARGAIPALARVADSTDTVTGAYAVHAIVNIDPTDVRAAPGLLRLIQDKDWDAPHVRGFQSLESLGNIKGASERSVPVLRRLLLASTDGFDPKKRYRRPAFAEQLEKLDPRDRSANGLIWDLKNRDASIRYRAALVAGSTTTVSPAVVPALAVAVGDKDPYVASRALNAIFKISVEHAARVDGSAYPRFLAAVDRLKNDKVEGFEEVAARGLAKIGPPLLPAMVDMLKRGTLPVETANYILSFYERDAVPFLTALMIDQSPNVRVAAAIALSRLEPTTPGIERELYRARSFTGAVARDVEAAQRRMGRSPTK